MTILIFSLILFSFSLIHTLLQSLWIFYSTPNPPNLLCHVIAWQRWISVIVIFSLSLYGYLLHSTEFPYYWIRDVYKVTNSILQAKLCHSVSCPNLSIHIQLTYRRMYIIGNYEKQVILKRYVFLCIMKPAI